MTSLPEMQRLLSSLHSHRNEPRVPYRESLVMVFKFLREHTDLYDLGEGMTESDLHDRLIDAFKTLPIRDLNADARNSWIENEKNAERDRLICNDEELVAPAKSEEGEQKLMERDRLNRDMKDQSSCTAMMKREELKNQQENQASTVEEIETSKEVEMNDSAEKLLKDLKLRRKYRYLILKISGGEVIPDSTGEPSFGLSQLQSSLPYSDCRYCIYDQEFKTDDGRHTSRLLFICWLPHHSMPKSKMAYVHGKIAIRKGMEGFIDVSATSFEDIKAAMGISQDDSDADSDI